MIKSLITPRIHQTCSEIRFFIQKSSHDFDLVTSDPSLVFTLKPRQLATFYENTF
jgi:hypothetical protein